MASRDSRWKAGRWLMVRGVRGGVVSRIDVRCFSSRCVCRSVLGVGSWEVGDGDGSDF